MDEHMIAKNKNQLTLIYNSNSRTGKQVLAYAQASKNDLLAIDIAKTKVPDTQWVEIAEHLKTPIKDLIDTSMLKENVSNYSAEDWIKVIQNNRDVLQKPIAINGTVVKQITNVTEILSLFEVDSAGLKKTMHHKPPTTSSTTENESFK